MFLVAGVLALLLWRVPGGNASPVVLVDQDGVVNATYVPYAVLAALGYGAVGLAGIHAYNLWAPILRKNDIRGAPDPTLAHSNREQMRDWLERVVGMEPGRSPVLEDVRGAVKPFVPFRRQDETQLASEHAHASAVHAVPAAPRPPHPRPVRPAPPQKKRRDPFVRQKPRQRPVIRP
ncbi:uncharacterized protein LOC125031908 [Penaeus chinensis]|uniref:uncharacterized protein LOC125031908 n=1 Tax=Penaeus chinensis TaxID=139456 RepID=UPI001FB646CA|nr:uncharacterized protein LOC125031908 [Penaeus chinensis]